MEIVHLSRTPFGEFYYDPLSRQGVALDTTRDPTFIGMAETFDPFASPDARKLIVADYVFDELQQAALRSDRGQVERIISEHFQ